MLQDISRNVPKASRPSRFREVGLFQSRTKGTRRSCTDTADWADSSSYTCEDYKNNGWCADGQVQNSNYGGAGAEENCCVCGKADDNDSSDGRSGGRSTGISHPLEPPAGEGACLHGPLGGSAVIDDGWCSGGRNYFLKSSGKCEDVGAVRVVGPDRCEAALKAMDPTKSNWNINLYGPAGCDIGLVNGQDYGYCNGNSNSKPYGCSAIV